MNRISPVKKAQVVSCLVEGNSIRATVRMTGVAKNTVVKLLCDLGRACSDYQDKAFVNLKCKRLQCDEIWSFVGAKEKNCSAERKAKGGGDAWTWTAICADTKLIPCWFVGGRDAGCAYHFMHDLKGRLANRVQMTTDGHRAYLSAVEDAFGAEIDYAMLQKIYGSENQSPETRYSPAICMGARKAVISGKPDFNHVSTSYAERQNLTMRMSMRRFTRLTNGFSKKLENHEHALALYFMYYNFCRIHQTLRVTPAMEANVADHVWSLEELIELLDRKESKCS
ncbi:MAG: IS1 family transposase [Acidobacteriota bacterium]|nr:IS1 family transposase [Acidobacteriota bacterium]